MCSRIPAPSVTDVPLGRWCLGHELLGLGIKRVVGRGETIELHYREIRFPRGSLAGTAPDLNEAGSRAAFTLKSYVSDERAIWQGALKNVGVFQLAPGQIVVLVPASVTAAIPDSIGKVLFDLVFLWRGVRWVHESGVFRIQPCVGRAI